MFGAFLWFIQPNRIRVSKSQSITGGSKLNSTNDTGPTKMDRKLFHYLKYDYAILSSNKSVKIHDIGYRSTIGERYRNREI